MLKSIKNIFGKIFKSKINQDEQPKGDFSLEELNQRMISADISPTVTKLITEKLDQNYSKENLKKILVDLCVTKKLPTDELILLVGINGSGKTTVAGKLMHYYKNMGKNIMLIAGDTFRAAAIDQLDAWCKKNSVPLYKSDSKDPAAVVFQGCQEFKNANYNLLIVDTAGRLQSNVNLMKELEKIKKSISKVLPDQKICTLLTIDSLLGQNSIDQAKQFNDAIGVDGVILTKMDGPAKGGTALTIMQQLKIPVVALSFGETEDSLLEFNSHEYADAIIG
jgi:fused signal recognition particle receptor